MSWLPKMIPAEYHADGCQYGRHDREVDLTKCPLYEECGGCGILCQEGSEDGSN